MTGFLMGAAFGALFGTAVMWRRGGNKKDMGQYAVGFGIFFGFVALFITIFIARQGA
ncbi:MAG: hypothetical protein OXC60_06450 [Litoreibacter sp.]|nr:hypothetical protein [Litoreibacter sp.]